MGKEDLDRKREPKNRRIGDKMITRQKRNGIRKKLS